MNRMIHLFLLASLVSPISATENLETIIVTATRSPQAMNESLASVTVINRDDIERLQAHSIQDVLRGLAGISVANSGGMGKATSLFLRGSESDQVLVLIDGIKVGSATLGTTAFEHIPIELIERIEIVRGPRSSLYGSEAIGGVIQIFTRKGGGELKPFATIGTGRYDSLQASLGIAGGGDQAWFNLRSSFTDTNGFNACSGTPDGAGCFTYEPDADAYQNLSTSLRAGYRFNDQLEIDAHILQTTGETDSDGSFVNQLETTQQTLGGSLRYTPIDQFEMTLVAGHSEDKADNLNNGVFQTRFDTERDSISLQNDFFFTDNHHVTLGFDYQEDMIDSNTVFDVTSRDNKGIFAVYQGMFSATQLQLSLRSDNNEQFNEHSTGGISLGYALTDSFRLTASYGTAFKAPTFNELYFPGFGNSNLSPEESRSYELGLNYQSEITQWSINAYQTKVDDLISFDATTFAPANIDEARIYGIEVIFGIQLNHWNINTNLGWLDPENRSSGANNGHQLPRRAEQSLRIDVDRQFQHYALGATLVAEGKRFDDLANSSRLGGYATIDLRAQYQLGKDWQFQARVENVLDKRYETADFFNQAGRGLFVTLRYQP